ncbi:MAG: hypothetical protein ACLP6E_04775 [Acidimicrobiales bacterium]
MAQVMSPGEVATQAQPRPRAETFMRRILFVPDGPATVGEASAHRIFNVAMGLSALRCLLSYVVFPIVTPLVGAATDVGPAIGIPIAVVALFFDVMGIRRFWLASHRWRWAMTVIYVLVMSLVASLLVGDIIKLA